MGAVGGGVFYGFGGWRNSPKGERLLGMTTAIKARAPVLGGNFAVWGLLFASFDCSFAAIRRKEDPWNSIAAGAATGGILTARMGLKAMGKSALVGGCLLALIEGLSILVSQKLSEVPSQMQGGRAAPPPVTGTLGGSGYILNSGGPAIDESTVSFDVNGVSADVYKDHS